MQLITVATELYCATLIDMIQVYYYVLVTMYADIYIYTHTINDNFVDLEALVVVEEAVVVEQVEVMVNLEVPWVVGYRSLIGVKWSYHTLKRTSMLKILL